MQERIEHDGPGQRILVVVAHPDDAEFMTAGSVARWVREGREVFYVLCTNGDKGASDPEMLPNRLAPIRQREQRDACRVLGVREVVFLGHEDGVLQNTLDLRRDIARQIRRLRPDAVVCQNPVMRWYGQEYVNHPDHRAAGDAALDAVFPSARDYHVFPELVEEGLLPHKVRHVYLSGVPDGADVWFDIGETIDQKIEALYQHRSQVGDNREEGAEFVRWIGSRMAEGRDGLQYAESFKYFRLG